MKDENSTPDSAQNDKSGFNFYTSYRDSGLELSAIDRGKFYDMIVEKAFTGKDPDFKKCSKMLKAMYVSQSYTLNKQRKGYEASIKAPPKGTPKAPPEGTPKAPPLQVQVQVQVQGEVQEKEQEETIDTIPPSASIYDFEKLEVQKQKPFRMIQHLELSETDFNDLVADYGEAVVNDTIDALENFAGIKKYKSAKLTLKNWIKNTLNRNPPPPKPKKLNADEYLATHFSGRNGEDD